MFSLATVSFPIGILLIPFGLFVMIYVVYSLFNLYNLFRHGVAGLSLYAVSFLFGFVSFALLGIILVVLSHYDFNAPVSLTGVAHLIAPRTSIKSL